MKLIKLTLLFTLLLALSGPLPAAGAATPAPPPDPPLRVSIATGLAVGQPEGFPAALPGGLPAALEAGPVAGPVARQFEETSYSLKDLDFISPTAGWAVGGPHWDQAARAYTATIIKTTDGGATWAPQPTGVFASLRNVDFIDANRGWAVGLDGVILHTSNGGAAWQRQAIASTNELRGVAFADAQHGWASGFYPTHFDDYGEPDNWQGEIWHTGDGGATWRRQNLPAGASLLNRIAFLNAQQGWVVGVKYTGSDPYGNPQHAGVVYRTTNGGQTWTELYSPGANIVLNAVEWVDANHGWVGGFPTLSSMDGGFVFHTADGGQTWQRQTPGGFFDPIWDIHFVDASRGYLVGCNYIAAWGPPVFRTQDGGATWENIRMAKHENEGLFGVTVQGDRVIAVGDHDIIDRSSRAWDSFAPPCYDGDCLFTQAYLNTHYLFHDVFFVNQQLGWAAGSRSYAPEIWGQVILHTANGGAAWQTQYEQAPPLDHLFSYFRLTRIVFVDARTGWAAGSSEEKHGAILHTTDGGQTWVEQGQELYASWDLEFYSIQFFDAHNGWALATGNFPSPNIFLARTTNGGQIWSWVDTGVSGGIAVGFACILGDLAFSDPLHGWAAGGLSQVVATQNGGQTWQQQTLSCGDHPCAGAIYAVYAVDQNNAWVAGEGIWRTSDAGQSWNPVSFGYKHEILNLQFVDAKTAWASTDRGEIWFTANGGGRWYPLSSGTGFALQGLHFANPQRGWFVGDGGVILHYASASLPVTAELFLPVAVR